MWPAAAVAAAVAAAAAAAVAVAGIMMWELYTGQRAYSGLGRDAIIDRCAAHKTTGLTSASSSTTAQQLTVDHLLRTAPYRKPYC
jgi:hypothetical protein